MNTSPAALPLTHSLIPLHSAGLWLFLRQARHTPALEILHGYFLTLSPLSPEIYMSRSFISFNVNYLVSPSLSGLFEIANQCPTPYAPYLIPFFPKHSSASNTVYHLLILIIISLLECRLGQGRDFIYFLLLYLRCLEQCLAHCYCPMNIC